MDGWTTKGGATAPTALMTYRTLSIRGRPCVATSTGLNDTDGVTQTATAAGQVDRYWTGFRSLSRLNVDERRCT